MSDKQLLNNSQCQQASAISSLNASSGEVQHANHLSEHIGSLYLNGNYSDIALIVEGCRLPSHRVILASRSEYFRALLYGGMRESNESEIEIKESGLASFKILLLYVYTGRLSLQRLREEALLDVLGLAHKYGFLDLETAITDYLKTILDASNLCQILSAARIYSMSHLADYCLQFADRNAEVVLNADSFSALPASGVVQLISRDSFCAKEIDIFLALQRWAQRNNVQQSFDRVASSDAVDREESDARVSSPVVATNSDMADAACDSPLIEGKSSRDEWNDILRHVRLPLMKLEELLNIVRPTDLISSDAILDAIKEQTQKRCVDLPYRGFSLPDVNIARPDFGASVVEGELKQALLNGDSENYDMERGFTRHPIEDHQIEGIVVRLGAPYIINHIRLLLWDRDQRSYSYYVEVSMDKSEWIRIVDYSHYLCRSLQKLYFAPRVVRFIRVVGTHNTVNRVFHLVSLDAMFSTELFQTDPRTAVVIPSYNVATVENSACVIEGVSRSRNALINGDSLHYDWDSGYTCHQIGSGSIVVQLSQPYLIDSVRLLLWDCDDRSYSYYVETSVDQRQWLIVADRTKSECKSWQNIEFDQPTVTCFIRITGTRNTANEVFHCVTFECPSLDPPEE